MLCWSDAEKDTEEDNDIHQIIEPSTIANCTTRIEWYSKHIIKYISQSQTVYIS